MDATEAEATTKDLEDPNAPAGRAGVHAILLAPLAVFAPPRGEGPGDFDALADQLAHLPARDLRGLLEWVLVVSSSGGRPGAGQKRCRLAAVLIRTSGYAILPPPRDRSDYVASVLRSRMGAQALAEGWAVELLRHATRFGPPPAKYLVEKLRIDAQDNARTIARIRERRACGQDWPGDTHFLADWTDDLRRAEALVAEGEAARGAGAGAAA